MAEAAGVYGSTFVHGSRSIHIDPELVEYREDAVERLGGIAARFARRHDAAVIMDERTRAVAGDEAVRVLVDAGWQVQRLVVPDPAPGRTPVCDDVTRDRLGTDLASPALIVAAGAGVINDLGKWLAHGRAIPYISVATAASMNGYTSANVAPTVGGVKMLERGSAPKAVLAAPRTVAGAPYELTASGLGDALAKSVSATDWWLNHALFGDEYVEEATGLVARIEPLYLEHPRDVRARAPEAIAALFDALMLTGVAMTMAGSSAPASGGEHLVSHTLDMMSSLDGHPHDLHGRQVGVGTILASSLYERVLAIESPAFDAVAARATDFSFWGRLGGHVARAYAPKVERLATAAAALSRGSAWDDLRAELAPMLRSSAATRGCLEEAGAAHTADQIGCTPGRLAAAFEHGHEIRSRFTILDLARMVGVMPRAAREFVDAL